MSVFLFSSETYSVYLSEKTGGSFAFFLPLFDHFWSGLPFLHHTSVTFSSDTGKVWKRQKHNRLTGHASNPVRADSGVPARVQCLSWPLSTFELDLVRKEPRRTLCCHFSIQDRVNKPHLLNNLYTCTNLMWTMSSQLTATIYIIVQTWQMRGLYVLHGLCDVKQSLFCWVMREQLRTRFEFLTFLGYRTTFVLH